MQYRLPCARVVVFATLLTGPACSSSGPTLGGLGAQCSGSSGCEEGLACVNGTCSTPCVSDSDCVGESFCRNGACQAPCTSDADCTEPTNCQIDGTGTCSGGRCDYVNAPLGSPCDDGDLCSTSDTCDGAGTCEGQVVTCDFPPPTECSSDDLTFIQYPGGTCNPTDGQCEYTAVETSCPNCVSTCLERCTALDCGATQCMQAGICIPEVPARCERAPRVDGTSCEQSPTVAGVCSSGTCVDCIGDADCNDQNECTVDTCVTETCANPPVPAGVACNDDTPGDCNAPQCDGAGACDQLAMAQSAGYVCRGVAGLCDIQEVCDGNPGACPSDVLEGQGVSCRPSTDSCDIEEVCDGISAACPGEIDPTGTICVPSIATCDTPEVCTAQSVCEGAQPTTCEAPQSSWYALDESAFGPFSTAIVWRSDAGGGISNTSDPSRAPVVTIDPSAERPVIAWREDPEGPGAPLYVRRFDGFSWPEIQGSATGDGVVGAVANHDIAVEPGPASSTVIAAWVDSNVLRIAAAQAGGWADYPPGSDSDTTGIAFSNRAPDLEIDSEGRPVVAYAGTTVQLQRLNGGAWEEVASSVTTGLSTQTSFNYPSLATGPNEALGVVWQGTNTSNGIFGSLYDPVMDVWDDLTPPAGTGISGGAARAPDLVFDSSGRLVVAYQAGAARDSIEVQRYDHTMGTWGPLGASATIVTGLNDLLGERPRLAASSDGRVAVAWSTDGRINAREFDGVQWNDIGDPSDPSGAVAFGDLGSPSIVYDALGALSLTWRKGENILYKKRQGMTWSGVGAASATTDGLSPIESNANTPQIIMNPVGHPTVGWLQDVGGFEQLYVLSWDGGSWQEQSGSASGLGVSAAAGGVGGFAVVQDSLQRVVAVWQDIASGGVYALRHETAGWEPLGTSTMGFGISDEAYTPGDALLAAAVDSSDRVIVTWVVAQTGAGTVTYDALLRRFDGSWSSVQGSGERPGLATLVNGGGGLNIFTGLSLSAAPDNRILFGYSSISGAPPYACCFPGGGLESTDAAETGWTTIPSGGMVAAPNFVHWDTPNDRIFITGPTFADANAIESGVYTTAWSALPSPTAGRSPCDGGHHSTLGSANEPVVVWRNCADQRAQIMLRQHVDSMGWEPIKASDLPDGLSNSFTISSQPVVGYANGTYCVAWVEPGSFADQVLVRCADE